jgi:hypothetical protein
MIFIYSHSYAIKRKIVPVYIALKQTNTPLSESLAELGIPDEHGTLECTGMVQRLPSDQVAFVARDKHGREVVIRLRVHDAENAMEHIEAVHRSRYTLRT